jgi:hypothetical protein
MSVDPDGEVLDQAPGDGRFLMSGRPDRPLVGTAV